MRMFLVCNSIRLEIISYNEQTKEAVIRNAAGIQMSQHLDIQQLKQSGWKLIKE